ncbi:MAG TPA: asparagine synthase (glutamine-hydrolyzing) [Gammaproteobacteria bacterium]|nr:asparagine synthase (glutamine-hydrolyzing) [Gammaproteobacteria bacterium]
MCGIALYCNTHGILVGNQVIQRMVGAIEHRGPDALNHVTRGSVSLGHSRLSIVDIEQGNQPMLSNDGLLALVFNGEIYNYQDLRRQLEAGGAQFKTRCDTEVVLHLLARDGLAGVRFLRGMFAFALHDQQSGAVHLVRDRLGIKPLFYHWDGEVLLAGSEAKALFASGLVEAHLDPAAIRDYFRYQFAVSPKTLFKGVMELPPGHSLTLEPGGEPQLCQYWDLQFPRDGEYESMDEDYWARRFADGLDEAAACHMIGDVPIGAYLSGGIDSAATTYLLNKHAPESATGNVQSYTIKFSNPTNDESALAREIADHLGVPNQTILLDDGRVTGFLSELEQSLYHLEQPQRLAVDVPHFMLSALVQSNGQKVVFTGDGSDELFGGYDCYRQDAIRVWGNKQKNQRQRRRFYLNEFGGDFAAEHLRLLSELHRVKNQRCVERRFGCYPAWHDFWHILDDISAPLFAQPRPSDDDQTMSDLMNTLRPRLDGLHPLNQSLYIETKTRLPGWILWKSDRLSMAHSVEARVPFMDHPLVEMAAQIPPGLKLNGMDEKYILRRVMMPHLPEHPSAYKKRAFYTPIRDWFFTAERQPALANYLSAQAIEEAGYFRAHTVSKYLKLIREMPPAQSMDEYYRIMKLEWVLLMVLSVQILHRQFVLRKAACFR